MQNENYNNQPGYAFIEDQLKANCIKFLNEVSRGDDNSFLTMQVITLYYKERLKRGVPLPDINDYRVNSWEDNLTKEGAISWVSAVLEALKMIDGKGGELVM